MSFVASSRETLARMETASFSMRMFDGTTAFMHFIHCAFCLLYSFGGSRVAPSCVVLVSSGDSVSESGCAFNCIDLYELIGFVNPVAFLISRIIKDRAATDSALDGAVIVDYATGVPTLKWGVLNVERRKRSIWVVDGDGCGAIFVIF
jgi:hypothetical protein